jgi:hypothetical protein
MKGQNGFPSPPTVIFPSTGHYFVATGSSSGLSAAMARMSSVIFIEQYFGLHMLHKWPASTSCGAAAVSGEQGRNVVRRGWRLLGRCQGSVE